MVNSLSILKYNEVIPKVFLPFYWQTLAVS